MGRRRKQPHYRTGNWAQVDAESLVRWLISAIEKMPEARYQEFMDAMAAVGEVREATISEVRQAKGRRFFALVAPEKSDNKAGPSAC